jgi:hypothetical protein
MEFFRNIERYGARRIQALLAQKQIKLSRRIVGKIMREEGLIAIQPRSFVPRTTIISMGNEFVKTFY